MCGRFALDHTWAEIHAGMSLVPSCAAGRNDPPRYNIAPTQDVGFLHRGHETGELTVSDGRWWLVPFWAKEIPKYPMFNARSETAREKSSFRGAFKSKRCLVPASGYFEWTKADDGKKDPHFIHLPEKKSFMFAGLWTYNSNFDITSCTILTAAAAPEIEHLHHRMPIILNEIAFDGWLDGDNSADEAHAMLADNQGASLVSYCVGREVGSSRASGADLIEQICPQQ